MAIPGTAGCLASLDPDKERLALPQTFKITKCAPHPGHLSLMPPRWGTVLRDEHQLGKGLAVVEGRGREQLEVGSTGREWLVFI